MFLSLIYLWTRWALLFTWKLGSVYACSLQKIRIRIKTWTRTILFRWLMLDNIFLSSSSFCVHTALMNVTMHPINKVPTYMSLYVKTNPYSTKTKLLFTLFTRFSIENCFKRTESSSSSFFCIIYVVIKRLEKSFSWLLLNVFWKPASLLLDNWHCFHAFWKEIFVKTWSIRILNTWFYKTCF